MKYELKNVKTYDSRNGIGFSAVLYKDGKKIADVRDAGVGGEIDIDYVGGRSAAKKEDADLIAWHEINGDWSWTYHEDNPSPNDAIEMLLEIWENNKRAKTKIVCQKGPEPTSMTATQRKKFRKEAGPMLEIEDFFYPKHTIADKEALKVIAKKDKGVRIWDPSIERFRPIEELIKAAAVSKIKSTARP
jgi:hypothetical protein